jgi:hypothetical protein
LVVVKQVGRCLAEFGGAQLGFHGLDNLNRS